MNLQFDAASHTYTLDGRQVPSVTQVLQDVVPGWQAGEYHLSLGSANHAIYAMLANGAVIPEIEMAPECEPYAVQWMGWRAATFPHFAGVEERVASVRYQYAGTLDILLSDDVHRLSVCDYKAHYTVAAEWQLAAYALAWEEMHPGQRVTTGSVIEIRPDGWKMVPVLHMARRKNEWLAILTAYRCRREAGKKEAGQNAE